MSAATLPTSLMHLLGGFRRRVRSIVALWGASRFVSLVLSLLLVVGFLDWCWHIDDVGLRMLVSTLLAAGLLWAGWKWIWSPLRMPLSDVFIAAELEKHHPQLGRRLSHAIQFLRGGVSIQQGSRELQQAVIQQATRQLDEYWDTDLINSRPVRRTLWISVGLCSLAALMGAFAPQTAAIVLQRWLFPWTGVNWPRQFELHIVTNEFRPIDTAPDEPLRVVRGERCELYVENLRGKLPPKVTLEFQVADQALQREPLRTVVLRDSRQHPHELAPLVLPLSRGPIRFRAVGGDDDQMRWQTIEVMQPPLVESFQLTITPPGYLSQEPTTFPADVGHVQGLIGSTVTIAGKADKPLRSATLRWKSENAATGTLALDQQSFVVSFPISDVGVTAWWLDLEDRHGDRNPDPLKYEVKGIADLLPEVRIESPETDITVTPDVELALKITSRDDLGLAKSWLSYKIEGAADNSEVIVPLWAASANTGPTQQTLDHHFLLSELGLKPVLGQPLQVILRASASDFFAPGPPHIGRSVPRVLTIIAVEEKRRELQDRVGDLADELQQNRQAVARSLQQLADLQTQAKTVGALRPEDLDALKRLDLEQRSVASRLLSPQDGVQAKAQKLQREFTANQVSDPEAQSKLQELTEKLAALGRDPLPAIDREMTKARKAAQASDPAAQKEFSETLAATEREEQKLLGQLEELTQLMAAWKNQRALRRGLQDLLTEQQQLKQMASDLGEQTLSKTLSELPPQLQAEIGKLAARQRKAADKLDQFKQQLESASKSAGDEQPDFSETAAEAAEELNERNLAGAQREAAQQTEANRLGQSQQQQQQILDNLKSLDDLLQNRRATDTETLVKRLKDLEQQFEQLHEEQADILRKTRQAQADGDEDLMRKQAERQQQLEQKLAKLEQQLQRLQLRDSQAAAERALQRLQQARTQFGQPEKRGQALQQQQEALDDLEQVQRELAEDREAFEELLAQEELVKLADQLRGLIERQSAVIAETQRLEQARGERQSFSRAQLKSLKDLAESEQTLRSEIAALAERLTGAEVVSHCLKGTVADLAVAVERLQQRQTDDATLQIEQAALHRLEQLAEVLQADLNPQKQPQGGGEKAGPAAGGPPGEGLSLLAEVQLCKLLQEQLLQRTTRLDELQAQAPGPLSPAQQAELQRLVAEQEQLSAITRNLLVELAEMLNQDDAEAKEAPKEKAAPVKTPLPQSQQAAPSEEESPEKKPEKKKEDPDELDMFERLDRAVHGMKQARDKLSAGEVSKPTRDIQQQVIRDLEAFLNQAQQPPPQSSNDQNDSENPPPAKSQPKGGGKKNRPLNRLAKHQPRQQPGQRSQPPQPGESGQGGQAGMQKRNSDNAAESADGNRDQKNAAAKELERRNLESDIWGHLPEKLREQLLNSYSERMLPQYEDLVRSYYESLAQPKDAPRR